MRGSTRGQQLAWDACQCVSHTNYSPQSAEQTPCLQQRINLNLPPQPPFFFLLRQVIKPLPPHTGHQHHRPPSRTTTAAPTFSALPPPKTHRPILLHPKRTFTPRQQHLRSTRPPPKTSRIEARQQVHGLQAMLANAPPPCRRTGGGGVRYGDGKVEKSRWVSSGRGGRL